MMGTRTGSCRWSIGGGTVVILIAVLSAEAAGATGFVETFADDPVAAGRWRVHDGEPARFVYDPVGNALLARYDTSRPTARLIRPLCRPLSTADSFSFRVMFRIESDGFWADPRRHAQIAFGLMNVASTGDDRVYGQDGRGAFDLISFDYYPNVSLFGGPSVGPTIINRDAGLGFSTAIDFAFGPETGMDDPGESPLPLDARLEAVVSYSGPGRRAVLRILRDGEPLPINAVGGGHESGGSDGDVSTIVTELAGAGFAVDSFGLMLWNDTSATFPTVLADVLIESVVVDWTAGGDFDGDGDVDGVDFGHLTACRTGPAVPQVDPSCQDADLDCDGDVDHEDFGLFQAGITGGE